MPVSSTALWDSARAAACRVAHEAWTAIQPFYQGQYEIFEKVDGPATEADRLADRLIVERLSELFPAPDFGYLTEESEDRRERLQCRYAWIIDPIDGTKEFIKGNGNFAIHIGLVERLEDGLFHPVAAAVYRPITGWMYSAVRGQGAVREREGIVESIRVSDRNRIAQMRSVVSKTHAGSRLLKLIESLSLEDYWQIGSLGVKVCTIAEGGAELYINLSKGKTKEWDTCAPHLILTEAGGELTDLAGQPLTYNGEDVYHHNGLLASNAAIHDDLLELVQKFLRDETEVQS